MGCFPSNKKSSVPVVARHNSEEEKALEEDTEKKNIEAEHSTNLEPQIKAAEKYKQNNTIKENLEGERDMITEFGESNFKFLAEPVSEEEKEMLVEKLKTNDLMKELSMNIMLVCN